MVKMPQRQRHNTGGGTGGADLPLLDPGVIAAHNSVSTSRCCVPMNSGCLKNYDLISLDSPTDCVRVTCNNENCTVGKLMHKECFETWENHALSYLKTCGRAKSWSEKQRYQNLWTKKGYDLAYKACLCLCARGYLRKDVHWSKSNEIEDENKNKKKKKNRQNQKPALITMGPGTLTANLSNNTLNMSNANHPCHRHRTNSISSTGSSPPSDGPQSPQHNVTARRRSKEFYADRNRHGSGGSMFAKRVDFSSFNVLPRNKINSYHIKMEDDGYSGNDDTRNFILSTLMAHKSVRVSCVLCQQMMWVFDRYPLLEGTFFVTPVQHTKSVIPIHHDGREQYLAAVCMGCLEGCNVNLRCSDCLTRWDGSSLILGTMYSFDIFAATPCCDQRFKCSKCNSIVMPAERRLAFSEFSRSLKCPTCGHEDHHFVKPLSYFIKEEKHKW